MYCRCCRVLSRCHLAIALVGILSIIAPSTTEAQDTWTNPAGGFFDVSTNWADGSAPGATESALFNLAATYGVNWDNVTGNTTNSRLTVDDGEVTFFSTGGLFTHTLTDNATINGGHLLLGRGPGEPLSLDVGGNLLINPSGMMTVRHASQLTVNDRIDFNGVLHISEGGIVENAGISETRVGTSSIASASAAVVNVNSGGTWNTGRLELGVGQDAEVNITGGGMVDANSVLAGGTFNSRSGKINVSGVGSQWNNSGSLNIGNRTGGGEFNLTGGGVATSFSTLVGGGAAEGSILVSGAGSRFNTTTSLQVGVPNTGTGEGSIRIEDGGLMTSASATLTEATVVITGADSRWENAGRLNFGDGEASDLSQFIRVRNGGTLESDEIALLDNSWLRIQDAGSTVSTAGDVFVGGFGDRGLLTVQNNAAMNVGGRLIIGLTGGAGDVQLFGGGANLNADQIDVGANGHLALLGGTQLTTERLWLAGTFNLEQGVANVTGEDSVLNIDQSNFSSFNPILELDDSTLNVAGQTVFGPGVEVMIDEAANFSSASVINNGSVEVMNSAVLGSSTRHDGFGGNGTLTIGSGVFDGSDPIVTLNDAGLADLGRLTNLRSAQLVAANGVSIGAGDTIVGTGSIVARLSGGSGSAIYATGGELIIGDAMHPAGFSTAGELYTGANLVRILDANQARFGSFTELGDSTGSGYLQVDNGAVINFGDNLVGHGTIDNQDTLATAIINNGTMQGNSAVDRLIVEGYVKGVGTFDNVQFNGTFAPGLSPACVDGNNFFFGPGSNLEMEIGGLIRCDEHDAIRAAGLLDLDGTLDVLLINGFAPEAGDSFDLFDWGTINGAFAAFDLPELDAGLRWNVSDLYTTGTLSVSAVPEPASTCLMGVLAAFVFCQRRRSRFPGQ